MNYSSTIPISSINPKYYQFVHSIYKQNNDFDLTISESELLYHLLNQLKNKVMRFIINCYTHVPNIVEVLGFLLMKK